MLLRRIVCPTQHHVSVKSNSWSSLSLVLMILSIFATRFSKSFHYCRRRFSLLRAAAENGIQHKSVFFFFFCFTGFLLYPFIYTYVMCSIRIAFQFFFFLRLNTYAPSLSICHLVFYYYCSYLQQPEEGEERERFSCPVRMTA